MLIREFCFSYFLLDKKIEISKSKQKHDVGHQEIIGNGYLLSTPIYKCFVSTLVISFFFQVLHSTAALSEIVGSLKFCGIEGKRLERSQEIQL